MIRPQEWFFVLAAALFLNVAASFPVVYGHGMTPEGTRFLGFVGPYHDDYQSYLAWIRQGTDGHSLFRDLYTTEPHPRTIFLPLFWFMGRIINWSGVPVMGLWWVVNSLAAVLLAGAVYRFICVFVERPLTRGLALVLAVTGSGLGWLWRWLPGLSTDEPIDLWLVETNAFMGTVDAFFTLPLALALVLFAFVRILSWVESGRWPDAVGAGLLGLVLGAVHLYDLVIFYAVLGVWALFAGRRRLPGMILIGLLPAGWLVYALVSLRTSILGELRWEMAMPSMRAVLLGWGLPLVLAIAALVIPRARRSVHHVWKLAVWPLVIAVLLLLPIDFGRKLILGVHVPLCILTASVVALGWEESPIRGRVAGFGGAGLLLLVCAIGSGVWYVDQFRRLEHVRSKEYASVAGDEALGWLNERAQTGEVILATYDLATRVPGATGSTVFHGHWSQTIDRDAKWRFAERIFEPSSSQGDFAWERSVLERNRVRWLVGEVTEHTGGLAADALGTPVWNKEAVVIWEVNGFEPASETEPWRSEGWDPGP